MQKLKSIFNFFKVKYDITEEQFLNALSEYTITFLQEPDVNYFEEYLNITLI